MSLRPDVGIPDCVQQTDDKALKWHWDKQKIFEDDANGEWSRKGDNKAESELGHQFGAAFQLYKII
jgi:hypothetical protein